MSGSAARVSTTLVPRLPVAPVTTTRLGGFFAGWFFAGWFIAASLPRRRRVRVGGGCPIERSSIGYRRNGLRRTSRGHRGRFAACTDGHTGVTGPSRVDSTTGRHERTQSPTSDEWAEVCSDRKSTRLNSSHVKISDAV